MITWLISGLAVLNAFAVWHLSRVTSNDGDERAVRALRVAGALAVALAIGAGVQQIRSSADSERIRKTTLDHEVAEKIAEHRIALLDNFFAIYLRANTVSGYVSYQGGLQKLPAQIGERHGWEATVTPELKNQLSEARSAHKALVQEALYLLDLKGRYPNRVPAEVAEWAGLTIQIKFEDIPKYINPYARNEEAVRYITLFGQALGKSVLAVKSSVHELER